MVKVTKYQKISFSIFFARLNHTSRLLLCFRKVRKMGGIFDKKIFILGTKLNVLINFWLRVEREVQFP